jgi:endoglucanase
MIILTVLGKAFAQTPSTPQPMTTNTAMQYFTDEGINVGINVGNTFDAVDTWTSPYSPSNPISSETAWGSPRLNQAYFNGLKNLGFKIVRIPVTWMGHIGPAPNYTLDQAWLRRISEVVNMANAAGLKAFINIHHDGNYSHGWDGWLNINRIPSDPTIAVKFEKVWEQIAEYFKNYGDWLMFQGFNELHNGDWGAGGGTSREYQIINNLNQRFTDAVRRTGGNNVTRYLLYYGYCTVPSVATNRNFVLPADIAPNGTTRQIVGFHYYEPIPFSHDGESITWDTRTFRTELERTFAAFKTRFIDNGIPVIIGESGPFKNKAGNATARQNRLLFIDFMFGKARENSIVPIYWETPNDGIDSSSEYADANLINRTTGQPRNQEYAEVLQRMITAINNATPLPIRSSGSTPAPQTRTINLGSYIIGVQEDGVTPNPNVAIWELSPDAVTAAKTSGAKFVLQLTNAPTAAMQFVWQGPATQSWWNAKDILGRNGSPLNRNITWDAGTKTLTINLNANTVENYNSGANRFTAQSSLNLLILYSGSGGVDALGIKNASLTR